jgi:hypothetical protein
MKLVICLLVIFVGPTYGTYGTWYYGCSCYNGGTCYGSSSTCRCPTTNCGSQCEISLDQCLVTGNAHYRTFNGVQFTYLGVCKHLLAQQPRYYWGSNPFNVTLKNALKNSKTAYTLYVETAVCSDAVRLNRDLVSPNRAIPVTVTVDGVSVKLPYSGSCYTVDYVGDSVRLQTTFNLVVTFNGQNKVAVMLNGDDYRNYGKLRGMCGANNGNSADDYLTSTGTSVSSGSQAGTTIGDSYVIPDPEAGTSSCTTAAPPAVNTTINDIYKRCYQIINSTGCFKDAFSWWSPKVSSNDANEYFSNCLYDAYNDDQSTICDSLAAFAGHCAANGVTADWRTATNCQLTCPTGMVPATSASLCQPTCDSPSASDNCKFLNDENCVCPTNQILFQGHCVSCCGCIDSSKVAHDSGTTWTDASCNLYACVGNTTNDLPCFSTIVKQRTGCPAGQVCVQGTCNPISTSTAKTTATTTKPVAVLTTKTTTAAPCSCVNGGYCAAAEMCGGCQQITVGCLKDNPRRLGKDRARLVGAVPLKVESKGFKGGGRIHQFLWRRSRAVSNAK